MKATSHGDRCTCEAVICMHFGPQICGSASRQKWAPELPGWHPCPFRHNNRRWVRREWHRSPAGSWRCYQSAAKRQPTPHWVLTTRTPRHPSGIDESGHAMHHIFLALPLNRALAATTSPAPAFYRLRAVMRITAPSRSTIYWRVPTALQFAAISWPTRPRKSRCHGDTNPYICYGPPQS
jgi:hypothetical protein